MQYCTRYRIALEPLFIPPGLEPPPCFTLYYFGLYYFVRALGPCTYIHGPMRTVRIMYTVHSTPCTGMCYIYICVSQVRIPTAAGRSCYYAAFCACKALLVPLAHPRHCTSTALCAVVSELPYSSIRLL
jgi:hypothetical protein